MLLQLDLPAGSAHEARRPRVVRLPRKWRVVRRVRAVVEGVLAAQPASVRESARLVTSELMENVVKYGQLLPDGTDPVVLVQLEDGVLTISSRNGVTSKGDVGRIFDILDRLQVQGDAQAVYIEAILQGMAAKHQSASLGLLRIVAEAGFELHATYTDNVLEILARKELS
jgi:hypothetical protein